MSTNNLSRAAKARRLSPAQHLMALIEDHCGDVVTVNRVDDPWSEGAPTYWHAFINAPSNFRAGSHTVVSVTGDTELDCLDELAATVGLVAIDEVA